MFYNGCAVLPLDSNIQDYTQMSPEKDLDMANSLNVASFVQGTHALGPGNRAIIWAQGCPFNCPGCIAPGWIPFLEAKRFTPEHLLSMIDLRSVDGFTFSGGEPMEQAGGLARLIRLARHQKEVNLICFTGYRYERLLNDPPNSGVRELLREVDVLIDGPFVRAKNDSLGLRGSTNQRIIHLTDCLAGYNLENQQRNLEVNVRDGELSIIGIPTPKFKSALDQIFSADPGRI
jgi:anaerobic ribonucleoside-triphosphate reductase activating protein